MQRWRLRYTGRVQGVGFRATCHAIARDHDVRGWVRNEPDGSVTLEAQGDPDELTAFTQAIETAMAKNIADAERTPLTPDQSAPPGFQISR